MNTDLMDSKKFYKRTAKELTHAKLKEVLFYDPLTGIFTWKIKSARGIIVGSIAGCQCDRYMKIAVFCKSYLVHRLAWFYTFGEWPKQVVDHINGNKTDNRIANLRDVSIAANNQNIHCTPKSKLGIAGVHQLKTGGGYRTKISVSGKNLHLGTFDTAEQAHSVYLKAKKEFHEGYTK